MRCQAKGAGCCGLAEARYLVGIVYGNGRVSSLWQPACARCFDLMTNGDNPPGVKRVVGYRMTTTGRQLARPERRQL